MSCRLRRRKLYFGSRDLVLVVAKPVLVAEMSLLEQIKVDLRAKYLQDRDNLQRQVNADPDMWTEDKLLEAAEKVLLEKF